MKARLARIRGNVGTDNWFTFFPREKKYHTYKGDYGLRARSKAEADRIFDYLHTNPARFGLALLKFATDLRGGAMGLVPLVDFRKTWSDDEVYDLLDLTQDEREAIDNCLPDYYDRRSGADS